MTPLGVIIISNTCLRPALDTINCAKSVKIIMVKLSQGAGLQVRRANTFRTPALLFNML